MLAEPVDDVDVLDVGYELLAKNGLKLKKSISKQFDSIPIYNEN